MKKLTTALLALMALTSTTFAGTQNISALYPMDSFNPNKFTASNIKEFVKRYSSEADIVLKKGEFETTVDYQARLAKGFKTKSLDSEKIYAFKMDSVSFKYDPDKAEYNVSVDDTTTNGRLFGSHLLGTDIRNNLRIGKLSRTSDRYKASNAYGKIANVIRIRGKDFYIYSLEGFRNVNHSDLRFPTDIEVAKKNSSCNKQVYVFAKLNTKTHKNSSSEFAAIETPRIGSPLDIQVMKYTVPMDIVGMVLRCSTGTVLSAYEPSKDDKSKPIDDSSLKSLKEELRLRKGISLREDGSFANVP